VRVNAHGTLRDVFIITHKMILSSKLCVVARTLRPFKLAMA